MIRDRDEQQKLLQEKQMQQLRAQVRRIFSIIRWNPSIV